MRDYDKIIEDEGLFFTHPSIKNSLDDKAYKQLLQLELYHWVSTIYWINHSLNFEILTRLANWFMNQHCTPMALDLDMSSGFRQGMLALTRWRVPFLKDRQLKSILIKLIHNMPAPHGFSTNDLLELLPLNLLPVDLKNSFRENLINTTFAENLYFRDLSVNPLLAKFETVKGFECFGCRPSRSEGLLIDPKLQNNMVFDDLSFSSFFSGMNGLVHGGFISMALDEIMGHGISLILNKLSLTTNLNVEFLKPVKCNELYRLESVIEDHSGTIVKATALIKDSGSSKICAKGKGTFYLVNKTMGEKLFPGLPQDPNWSEMFL
jgi:acyl-coenzyme A thioesterase PaaI-like protein